ncbi:hypothetical protein POX_c04208 [Penicillium oxalicum]|uniref:hypothetical protein n=1 Tax=Penicillium oxalicum TaxID=69781 RepID=UPI0020B7CA9C|nr:hypothetical protein POX_c04208 [Penicillium oxalicum]KAI2791351.1 hypothetical protein POX_c04208 [Penicillium oxalicum]
MQHQAVVPKYWWKIYKFLRNMAVLLVNNSTTSTSSQSTVIGMRLDIRFSLLHELLGFVGLKFERLTYLV